MIIREATVHDIEQMHLVRNSVTENILSNPNLVTKKDYEDFITVRGKGWVCEMDNQIAGFAVADLKENNIWALFIHPKFEKKGIGQRLHNTMLDWYFSNTKNTVWLSTAFHTRAEQFYKKAGWTEVGTHGTNETRFEMTYDDWVEKSHF